MTMPMAPGAHLVKTAGYQRATQLIEKTFRYMCMSCLWGPPGVGKTTAVEEAVSHADEEIVVATVPGRGSARSVRQAVLRATTGLEYNVDTERLDKLAYEQLLLHPRLILDEADRLQDVRAFEAVRDWRDASGGKIAIVFVGGPQTWEVLSRRERLADRIRYKREVTALSEEDMLKALPLYHDIYQNISPTVASMLWRELRGRFRKIDDFTWAILDLLEGAKSPKVTAELARKALGQMGTQYDVGAPKKNRVA